MRLNMLLQIPVRKMKTKANPSLPNINADGKHTWTSPTFLLLFLQNTIEQFTPEPAGSNTNVIEGSNTPMSPKTPISPGGSAGSYDIMKFKLPAWENFKTVIYEIYDHRIYHAPEINGAINTTYLGMEEHLICYFAEKHIGRAAIERKIVEFLSALKYYADYWVRAKQYAQLVGFMQTEETFQRRSGASDTRPPQRLNDGKLDEVEIPANDIYIQEFFLHCYSLMTKDRK